MKELTYKVMPAIGGSNTTKKHGTLLDRVLAIPYLVVQVIPPLNIFNSVLRTGVCDAGMSGGCIWTPFEIDEEEYGELVEELLTLQHRDLAIATQCSVCADYSEWNTKRSEERAKKHARCDSNPTWRMAKRVAVIMMARGRGAGEDLARLSQLRIS